MVNRAKGTASFSRARAEEGSCNRGGLVIGPLRSGDHRTAASSARFLSNPPGSKEWIETESDSE
jgi:hypothetical protein